MVGLLLEQKEAIIYMKRMEINTQYRITVQRKYQKEPKERRLRKWG